MPPKKTEKTLSNKLISFALGPYQLFRNLCFYTGLTVIVGVFICVVYVGSFLQSLPDLSQKNFKDMKTIAQKRILQKREDKRKEHHWTEIKEINRNYLYAIVMSEDSGFFEHDGIDFEAILSSVAVNLRHKKNEFGASTISQQVTKNLFLESDKKILRKIKEVLITERIEKRFNKNEILEIYLNVAEFGPDIFGVEEAAKHYFGKLPMQINAAEGAYLALMLPSPRRHHFAIFENKNLSPAKKKKIRRILGDMLANDFISHKQYQEYSRYKFFKPTSQKPINRKTASVTRHKK